MTATMQRSLFVQSGVASVKRFAIENLNMFRVSSLVQARKAFHTDDDSVSLLATNRQVKSTIGQSRQGVDKDVKDNF